MDTYFVEIKWLPAFDELRRRLRCIRHMMLLAGLLLPSQILAQNKVDACGGSSGRHTVSIAFDYQGVSSSRSGIESGMVAKFPALNGVGKDRETMREIGSEIFRASSETRIDDLALFAERVRLLPNKHREQAKRLFHGLRVCQAPSDTCEERPCPSITPECERQGDKLREMLKAHKNKVVSPKQAIKKLLGKINKNNLDRIGLFSGHGKPCRDAQGREFWCLSLPKAEDGRILLDDSTDYIPIEKNTDVVITAHEVQEVLQARGLIFDACYSGLASQELPVFQVSDTLGDKRGLFVFASSLDYQRSLDSSEGGLLMRAIAQISRSEKKNACALDLDRDGRVSDYEMGTGLLLAFFNLSSPKIVEKLGADLSKLETTISPHSFRSARDEPQLPFARATGQCLFELPEEAGCVKRSPVSPSVSVPHASPENLMCRELTDQLASLKSSLQDAVKDASRFRFLADAMLEERKVRPDQVRDYRELVILSGARGGSRVKPSRDFSSASSLAPGAEFYSLARSASLDFASDWMNQIANREEACRPNREVCTQPASDVEQIYGLMRTISQSVLYFDNPDHEPER